MINNEIFNGCFKVAIGFTVAIAAIMLYGLRDELADIWKSPKAMWTELMKGLR